MIPNLDCMVADDLRRFATLHRGGRNRQAAAALLEPGAHRPRHWRRAVAALASYADLKATAMAYRAGGQIDEAQRLEERCDEIYAQLPESARW